jgi:3-methyladenine DNA glycosylase AlkC
MRRQNKLDNLVEIIKHLEVLADAHSCTHRLTSWEISNRLKEIDKTGYQIALDIYHYNLIKDE